MARSDVWAVTMVRDEADVVLSMLGQLVNEGVDGIIVADNMSSDETVEKLRTFSSESIIPVCIEEDQEVGYYQSRKMTALARKAASEHGAEWIIPVDADECWYSRGDRLATELRGASRGVMIVGALLYNHFRTALDVDDPDPFKSMIYRQKEPGALRKVAVRWHPSLTIEMGNHGASFDGVGIDSRVATSRVEIRHFPYRSPEQFIRKARNGGAAYKATDLPSDTGAHWRQYDALIEKFGEEAFIRDVWERYYHFVSPTDGGLVHDPAPYLRW